MKEHLEQFFPDSQQMIELFQMLQVVKDGHPISIYQLIDNTTLIQGSSNPEQTLEVVNQVCQEYLLRKKRSERWDIQDNEFLRQNHSEIFKKLRQLGFVDEIKPSLDNYEHGFLLGALEPTVKQRREYLERLVATGEIKSISDYALLGGQRPLIADKEPSAALDKIDTELDMMVHDWESNSTLKRRYLRVDAPMRKDGSRPNTQDTIEKYLKYKNIQAEIKANGGKLKPSIVVSNQPYVKRQHLVIEASLPQGSVVHTIGSRANKNIEIGVLLDEVARFVYQTKQNLVALKKRVKSEENAMSATKYLLTGYEQLQKSQTQQAVGNLTQAQETDDNTPFVKRANQG